MVTIASIIVWAVCAQISGIAAAQIGGPAWALLLLLASGVVVRAAWFATADRGPMTPVWHFLSSLFFMYLLVWYAPSLAELIGGLPEALRLGYGLVLWAGIPVAMTGAPIWRHLWDR